MELQKQINYAEYLQVSDGKPVTTSKIIAEVFGKRHDHVIRDIRVITERNDIDLPNFREISYTDTFQRQQPMYLIDRDGFMLLVMGFTGKEALVFKIGFIKAFNSMEAELMKRNSIQTPSNLLEAMEFATNQLRISIEQQKVLIIEKDNKIEEDKPKVFVYEEVIDSSKVYDMATTAKIYNFCYDERNRLVVQEIQV